MSPSMEMPRHGRAASILLLACLAACSQGGHSGDGAAGAVQHVYTLLPRLGEAQLSSTAIEPRAIVVGDEERAAIWAHAPASFRFSDVPVGRSAALRFGIGIQAGGVPSDGVRFSVRIDSGHGEMEVWSRDLVPSERPAERRWIDVEVPLAAFAGQRIGLTFVTSPRDNPNADYAAWSMPEVVAAEAFTEDSGPIRRKMLVERLDTESVNRVDLPATASLDLAAEVVRVGTEDVPTEGVRFRVLVDNDVLVDRAVPSVTRVSSFGELVPLVSYGGRQASLRFDIVMPEATRGKLRAHWLHAALLQEETTPRQPAGSEPDPPAHRRRHTASGPPGNLRLPAPDQSGLRPPGRRLGALRARDSARRGRCRPPRRSSPGFTPPNMGFWTAGRWRSAEDPPSGHRNTADHLRRRPPTRSSGKAEGFDQGEERWVHIPWARGRPLKGLSDSSSPRAFLTAGSATSTSSIRTTPTKPPELFASTFHRGPGQPTQR